MHVKVCGWMFAHICVYVYALMFWFVYISVCAWHVCICIHVCTCVCVCVCAWCVCICIHVYIYIYIYMYTYMYIYMYVCMQKTSDFVRIPYMNASQALGLLVEIVWAYHAACNIPFRNSLSSLRRCLYVNWDQKSAVPCAICCRQCSIARISWV
jgi:hypothetical protein